MKNSFMVVAALACTQASATSGLEQIVTDKIMNYAGLSNKITSVDLAGDKAETPRVETFGYETA